jgi:hypothetical protein
MNARIVGLFVGLIVMLNGCGTYTNIYSDYDRSTDFNLYRTFAWVPDTTVLPAEGIQAYDNDIVRNNAKNYISHNLARRGMLVNPDEPDALFQLVLLNEKREEVVRYYTHVHAGYYFHNRFYYPYYYPHYRYYTWYGWANPPFWNDHQVRSYTRTYVKGAIVINMYDRAMKKLIWTGSAEGDIYDLAYLRHDVHPAIDRIMQKFPVRVRSKESKDEELKFRDRVVRANVDLSAKDVQR